MRTADSDSPTKQKLLDAAQELMLAKGFTATSVDEVCAAAGVTKGSFFHYFESKEHLGRMVAEHFFAARKQQFQSAPFWRKKDPRDRVYGFIDLLIERSCTSEAGKGCLLGTFVQELSETHPAIRSVCAACFAEQVAFFKRDLDEAKALYAARARWDTQSLAEHFLAVIQGAIILAKAKQDPKVIGESAKHFKEYLKSLFGK
ncbi:MAG: TetR/AcrR family transcriptional regulator [Gemmataceae bacterium]|nr:TetR/AcrR family transcriptional regulator [Gemmataceae bacterium]